MNRRDLIETTALLMFGASCAHAQSGDHPHAGAGAAAGPAAKVAATTADCLVAGEACLSHCLAALSAKDDSMATCARAVRDMLAACQATLKLASAGSPHAPAMAALCARICRDCEAACGIHAQHHDACKRCMEACARCAAACDELVG